MKKNNKLNPKKTHNFDRQPHGESWEVADVQNVVLWHIFVLELNNGIGLIIYGLRMSKLTRI